MGTVAGTNTMMVLAAGDDDTLIRTLGTQCDSTGSAIALMNTLLTGERWGAPGFHAWTISSHFWAKIVGLHGGERALVGRPQIREVLERRKGRGLRGSETGGLLLGKIEGRGNGEGIKMKAGGR